MMVQLQALVPKSQYVKLVDSYRSVTGQFGQTTAM